MEVFGHESDFLVSEERANLMYTKLHTEQGEPLEMRLDEPFEFEGYEVDEIDDFEDIERA